VSPVRYGMDFYILKTVFYIVTAVKTSNLTFFGAVSTAVGMRQLVFYARN
jgi:hypothetical protein